MGVSPRLRLVYLLVLAVALGWIRNPWILSTLACFQLLLLASARIPITRLSQAGRRLRIFFVVILVSYLFVPVGPALDAWRSYALFGIDVQINVGGPLFALSMCVRVLTLVLASIWAREAGPPEEFAQAMRQLRIPQPLVLTVEGALTLVSGGGTGRRQGGGKGPGKGGGRGGRNDSDPNPGLSFKDLRGRRLGALVDAVHRGLQRAEEHLAAHHPGLAPALLKDTAIVMGLSVAMMGMKMFQVMPGLPVAPGHKNVVMVPLFLLAAALTSARFGGTWTGATVGTISFLLGYGKFGVLECLQFIIPGLMADLLVPLVRGRRFPILAAQFCLVGAMLGAGRFSANIAVLLLAGGPVAAFILYLPALGSQLLFGALSGLVTPVLLKAFNVHDRKIVQETGNPREEHP